MRLRPALLAVLLMVSGCSAPQGPQMTHPRPSPPAPAGIAAFLPEARGFVELHRGLKFKKPLAVQYLDDATFTDRLIADQRKSRTSTDREGILLRAVGLLDPSVDIELAVESLLRAGVIGYYDPRKKVLAVRGTRATAQARHALIHELTHALQDQWFGIDTPDDMDGDASAAFKSVVEGDARRIEQMYITGLPAADRTAIQHEGDSGLPGGIPPVLIQELGFPYLAGAGFLQVLELQGSQASIDAAFRRPPVATAQVMQPNRYLGGFLPIQVPVPSVPRTMTSDGVFGEFRFALILGPLVPAGQLAPTEFRAALAAWQGDHFATWREGEKDCVTIDFRAGDQEAEAALLSVLQKYAATRPGSTTRAEPLSITACA